MNRIGSQLIQAVMLLAVSAAAITGLMSLRSLSNGKEVLIEQRSTKKAHIATAALRMNCDKYLYHAKLTRNPATEISKLRDDFPEIQDLSALASIPNYAPDHFTETEPVPVLITVRVGNEQVVSRIEVYGKPGTTGAGATLSDHIEVSECLPNHFAQECRRGIKEVDRTIEYYQNVPTYQEDGFFALTTLGKCLTKSYAEYGTQHCIEPNMTLAQVFNHCRALHENAKGLSEGVRNTINEYCGVKLRERLMLSPYPWRFAVETCLTSKVGCEDAC